MNAYMANHIATLAIFVIFASLTGCVSRVPSSSQLRQVSLGMSKNEIVTSIGEPSVARGSIRNKYNQAIEVWEYTFALPSKDSAGQVTGKAALTVLTAGIGAVLFEPEKKDYWLYFLDDTLVQWGEAGDWNKEPERIYEFDFNPSRMLTR